MEQKKSFKIRPMSASMMLLTWMDRLQERLDDHMKEHHHRAA